jgi:hypothetical protein
VPCFDVDPIFHLRKGPRGAHENPDRKKGGRDELGRARIYSRKHATSKHQSSFTWYAKACTELSTIKVFAKSRPRTCKSLT